MSYAGIAPTLKLDRKGMFGHGTTMGTVENLKQFDCEEPEDILYQIEGYQALLRMTGGRPISIVVAEPSLANVTDPMDRLFEIMDGYKSIWDGKNQEALAAVRDEAIQSAHKTAFGWFQPGGLRRRLRNSSVTAFYSTPAQSAEGLYQITHPGQEPFFNNLQPDS